MKFFFSIKNHSLIKRNFSSKIDNIMTPSEQDKSNKSKVIEFPKEEKEDLNLLMQNVEKLPSLYKIQKKKISIQKTFSIQELMHSKEFSFGSMMLFFKQFSLAEEIFNQLKTFVFKEYLGTPIYTMIIRRLGIAMLKSGKVKEGIMEIENVDEFANDKETFGPDFKFNASMDRLRAYIYYDQIRAVEYSDYLFKLKREISNLEREQLAVLFYSVSVAYFINNSKPFEEIKTMIRKSINYHRDPYFKANAITNLAVIIYFECKTHNDTIDKDNEKNRLTQLMKEQTEISRLQGDIPEVEEKYRKNRKYSENDLKIMKKMKRELEEYKIDEKNPILDKRLKALAKKMYNEEKKKEKLLKTKTKAKDSDYHEKIEKLNILNNSKLPQGVRVSPLEYNKEKVQNLNYENELNKILNSEVDYENDLDNISSNIFLALKLYEMVHNLKIKQDAENDNENMKMYTSNLTKDCDFIFYISRYENYRKFYNLELSQEEIDKFKTNFNFQNEYLDFNQINSFEDLIEKDKFQTALKNPLCFKPILFLAELYTEYSRKYRNETEFWIKYSINILYKFKTNVFNYRALALLAAFLIDVNDIINSEKLLKYLYSVKEIEEDDPLTYNMIQLLYGILMKLNPKTKGEGLELIERAQYIKENLMIEEKMFHIFYDEFHLGSDIDPDYLRELLSVVNKLENSGVKL